MRQGNGIGKHDTEEHSMTRSDLSACGRPRNPLFRRDWISGEGTRIDGEISLTLLAEKTL